MVFQISQPSGITHTFVWSLVILLLVICWFGFQSRVLWSTVTAACGKTFESLIIMQKTKWYTEEKLCNKQGGKWGFKKENVEREVDWNGRKKRHSRKGDQWRKKNELWGNSRMAETTKSVGKGVFHQWNRIDAAILPAKLAASGQLKNWQRWERQLKIGWEPVNPTHLRFLKTYDNGM